MTAFLAGYFSGCLSFSYDIVLWTITGDYSSYIGFSDWDWLLSLRGSTLDNSGFWGFIPNAKGLSLFRFEGTLIGMAGYSLG